MYNIVLADVLEWASGYDGPQFHAMITDPPYHLTSITKRFGQANSAPAKGDVYNRASRGFMGQQWDGGDLAFRPETWEALMAHLYPGAFGMAFASSRGWHRMACAIEDAGLIIHPSIFMFGWNYLSGFPKATRIDTQVDKAAGADSILEPNPLAKKQTAKISTLAYGDFQGAETVSKPATELAQAWAGHRYGLQALKPALEPIILFQKPYQGRPVDNITATGAGALWIDGGRIETGESWSGRETGNGEAVTVYGDGLNSRSSSSHASGRWPSNLVLVHHPLCNGTCHPDCAVRALDEQSGERSAGGNTKQSDKPITKNVYGEKYTNDFDSYADSGPASRMFYQADWQYEVAEQLANATPLHYEPKASSAEREAGLARLETVTRHRVNTGGLENEPRFAPTQVKNNHPTVKSISLAIYLSKLLAPPVAYTPRRLLVPFSGVGSEVCGAILSGQWEEITGIEMSESYCKIARARIKFWDSVKEKVQLYGLDAILKTYGKQDREIPNSQLRLPF